MADQNINFKITANARQAKDEFKSVDQNVQNISGSLKNMASTFGVVFGSAAIIGFLKESVRQFTEEEKAVRLLETTLERSAKGLTQFAAEMQKVTTYGDEQIIMAQKMIADFTKNEEEIKKVTKATLDFAAAKQIDLVSASEIVSKSIYGETNMLGRYGVTIQEGLKGTEKFEAITKKLSEMFSGQAQAAANTYGGRLEQLKNKFGDVQEKIIMKLLPAIDSLITKFNNAVESIDKLLNIDVGKGSKLIEFLKEASYYLNVPARMGEGGQVDLSGLKERLQRQTGNLLPDRPTKAQMEESMRLMRETLISEMTAAVTGIDSNIPELKTIGKIANLKLELERLGKAFQVAGSDAQIAKINIRVREINEELTRLSGLGSLPLLREFGAMEETKRAISQRGGRFNTIAPEGSLYTEAGAFLEKMKQQYAALYEVSSIAADSIGSLFMGMWESVFGKANNLFEQFIANIVSRLADLASQSLVESIFGFLLNTFAPGVGSLTSAAISQRGSRFNKSQGEGTIVIPVYIGDQKVDTVIVESIGRNQRLRKL